MPRPKPGEDKEAYVSRFMSSSEARKDFPDEKQRAAVAYSMWGEKKNGGEIVYRTLEYASAEEAHAAKKDLEARGFDVKEPSTPAGGPEYGKKWILAYAPREKKNGGLCAACGGTMTTVPERPHEIACIECGLIDRFPTPPIEKLDNLCRTCLHPLEPDHGDFGCGIPECACTLSPHLIAKPEDVLPNAHDPNNKIVDFTCKACGNKFQTGVDYDNFDPSKYPSCPKCGGEDILDNAKNKKGEKSNADGDECPTCHGEQEIDAPKIGEKMPASGKIVCPKCGGLGRLENKNAAGAAQQGEFKNTRREDKAEYDRVWAEMEALTRQLHAIEESTGEFVGLRDQPDKQTPAYKQILAKLAELEKREAALRTERTNGWTTNEKMVMREGVTCPKCGDHGRLFVSAKTGLCEMCMKEAYDKENAAEGPNKGAPRAHTCLFTDTRSGDRLARCPICGNTPEEAKAEAEKKNAEGETKPYFCGDCDFTSPDFSAAHAHIEATGHALAPSHREKKNSGNCEKCAQLYGPKSGPGIDSLPSEEVFTKDHRVHVLQTSNGNVMTALCGARLEVAAENAEGATCCHKCGAPLKTGEKQYCPDCRAKLGKENAAPSFNPNDYCTCTHEGFDHERTGNCDSPGCGCTEFKKGKKPNVNANPRAAFEAHAAKCEGCNAAYNAEKPDASKMCEVGVTIMNAHPLDEKAKEDAGRLWDQASDAEKRKTVAEIGLGIGIIQFRWSQMPDGAKAKLLEFFGLENAPDKSADAANIELLLKAIGHEAAEIKAENALPACPESKTGLPCRYEGGACVYCGKKGSYEGDGFPRANAGERNTHDVCAKCGHKHKTLGQSIDKCAHPSCDCQLFESHKNENINGEKAWYCKTCGKDISAADREPGGACEKHQTELVEKKNGRACATCGNRAENFCTTCSEAVCDTCADKAGSPKGGNAYCPKCGNPENKNADRPITQDDMNAAARGNNMLGMSIADLKDLIATMEGKPEFAAKVTVAAAKQMMAAKRRMGAGENANAVLVGDYKGFKIEQIDAQTFRATKGDIIVTEAKLQDLKDQIDEGQRENINSYSSTFSKEALGASRYGSRA